MVSEATVSLNCSPVVLCYGYKPNKLHISDPPSWLAVTTTLFWQAHICHTDAVHLYEPSTPGKPAPLWHHTYSLCHKQQRTAAAAGHAILKPIISQIRLLRAVPLQLPVLLQMRLSGCWHYSRVAPNPSIHSPYLVPILLRLLVAAAGLMTNVLQACRCFVHLWIQRSIAAEYSSIQTKSVH